MARKRDATALIKFSNGAIRIIPITVDLFNGFLISCPITGDSNVEVRYWYTDPKGRRVYLEWNNVPSPTEPPPISA